MKMDVDEAGKCGIKHAYKETWEWNEWDVTIRYGSVIRD